MSSRTRRAVLALAGLAAPLLVVPLLASTAHAAAAPPLPGADPFYKPPASLHAYHDGQVIRTRPVAVSLVGGVPLAGARAYQLLYRTDDGSGRVTANVTTLLVPDGPAPKGGRDLVSLQDAEDSMTTNCAPSYQLRVGEHDDSDMMLELAATAPWFVATGRDLVIPDPEGPRSEMFVRTAEAHFVLDSIRAVEHFAPAQLDGTRTPVALAGYSGGGNETMATAEIQPSYAPELNVVGVAAGGSYTGDRAADAYVDTNASGAVMGGLLGLQRAEPALRWSRLLNAYGRKVAKTVANGPGCVSPVVSPYGRIKDWTRVSDPLDVPRIARAIARNSLGRRAPGAPTFLYISLHDQLISPADQDRLAARYCAAGVHLDYYRDPLAYPYDDHIAAAAAGFIPRALSYLGDRFAGGPAPDTCAP